MKLTAHCFAPNAKINPGIFIFKFGEYQVELIETNQHGSEKKEALILRISKTLSTEEIETFKKKNEPVSEPETYFSKRSRIYEEVLVEVAQVLEGLLSILYPMPAPKFDTAKPIVNLIGETNEEWEMLDSDSIVRGFGYMSMPDTFPNYKLEDNLKEYFNRSINHGAALSFHAQATRSFMENDQEVAFFLFFRIVDGYFAHGSSNVTKALLKHENELVRYIPYEEDLKTAIETILKDIKQPSKTQTGYKGMLEDIVQIRHQLTHFSASKPWSHHNPRLRFGLSVLNAFLHRACSMKLFEEIGIN